MKTSIFGTLLTSAALVVASQQCYSGVYIIACRGTFESQDYVGYGFQGALVTSLLNAIPNSNASAVIYPASVYNYGDSVGQGAVNAQQQIIAYHNACPTSAMVLLGYSQGAQVIGQSITGGSTYIPVLGGTTTATAPLPLYAGSNIIALQLTGDPNRALGQGTDYDPNTCSTGSSTPRNGTLYTNMQPYASALIEWCHQGDPVCCTDGSDAGSHVGYFLSQDNVNKMTQVIVQKYKASVYAV